MKNILLVLIILLFTATSAFCGEFEDTLKKAEQGNAPAQYNLALIYVKGQGVPQNFKLAYVWSSLSAAQGYENSIKVKDITAPKLTPNQLSEAQDLAAKIQYQIDNPTEQQTPLVPVETTASVKQFESGAKESESTKDPVSSLGEDLVEVHPQNSDTVIQSKTKAVEVSPLAFAMILLNFALYISAPVLIRFVFLFDTAVPLGKRFSLESMEPLMHYVGS